MDKQEQMGAIKKDHLYGIVTIQLTVVIMEYVCLQEDKSYLYTT